MKPFTFEELQKIVELKATDLLTDELIFESTITHIEKLLRFSLEDRNYNEIQTVKDRIVYTDYDHITEMINITDMNTKLRVPNCIIDGRKIILLSAEYEGHVLFLNYNAGFTEDTIPADLKETIVKLFILKKKNFLKNLNNEENESFEISADVQKIIHSYKRKSL